MQMPKLILIKHASPFVIPGTPPEKWRLSDKGKEACLPLADAIKPLAPTVIVSSEEPKAIETAEIVANQLGVPHATAAGLHEHDRSNVPHMRSGEFISYVELFFRKPHERVLGRETADKCAARFDQAVKDALAKHPDETIAVIAHGTVLALFLAARGDGDADGFGWWRKLGLPSFVVLSLPELAIEKTVERVG